MATDLNIEALAIAHDEDGWETIEMSEFWLPDDWYDFPTKHYYVISRKNMDGNKPSSRIFNTFTEAKEALKEILNETYRFTGGDKEFKKFPTVELSDEFYRELEYEDAEDERYTSSSSGDYGPGNPWAAPGMKISDFIGGVY